MNINKNRHVPFPFIGFACPDFFSNTMHMKRPYMGALVRNFQLTPPFMGFPRVLGQFAINSPSRGSLTGPLRYGIIKLWGPH